METRILFISCHGNISSNLRKNKLINSMKKYFILGVLLTIFGIRTFGQTNVTNIPFFESPPIIDGLPDNLPKAAEWRIFSFIEKSNEQNKDYNVRYKIGYNYAYMYLLIESNSDSIIIRDRGVDMGALITLFPNFMSLMTRYILSDFL